MRLKSLAVAAARRRRDLWLQHLREILLGSLRLVESPNDPLPSLSHVFSPSDWLVVDMRSSHRALPCSPRNVAGRADMCSALPRQRPAGKGHLARTTTAWSILAQQADGGNDDPRVTPLFARKIGARHAIAGASGSRPRAPSMSSAENSGSSSSPARCAS